MPKSQAQHAQVGAVIGLKSFRNGSSFLKDVYYVRVAFKSRAGVVCGTLDLEVSCQMQVQNCSFSVPHRLHHASKNYYQLCYFLFPLLYTPERWKKAGTEGSYARLELFYRIKCLYLSDSRRTFFQASSPTNINQEQFS